MKSRLFLTAIFFMAVLCVSIAPAFAQGGFNEWGYNYGARLFNGWYGQWGEFVYTYGRNPGPDDHWSGATWDAWIVMKWSKDWTPAADEPVGAWCTNHWTWYTDDYESGWYGFETRVTWNEETAPVATYRVEEFMKIMSVGDDSVAWAMYEAGGAYSAGWGSYGSGVPRYVVYVDVIEIYDTATGSLVASFDLCTTAPKGLGQPIF